ncbi:phosphoribosylformylglycinamidine synthase [Patescibacteria group bacterium]|nr:MAG: phosphoribosylformylglycinamidine synthase [Patescibacteria group bacterium]
MAIRIDVTSTISDARALVKAHAFQALAGSVVKKVYVVDSYLIDASLSKPAIQKVRNALTNAQVETSHVGRWLPAHFSYGIEVGFLPGVTDNVATTTQQTIEDVVGRAFKNSERVYSSQTYFIEGTLSRNTVQKIARSIHNPLIQSAIIHDSTLRKHKNVFSIPRVVLSGSSRVLDIDLEISDEELESIGKYGIKDSNGARGPLGLDLDALKAIRSHFQHIGRKPTDIEIESFAQTWSEHCKHTIFSNPIDSIKDGIYRTYIKGATKRIRAKKGKKDFCVSVFKDNSGGIVFDENYVVTHKVETHNSPSALDPYGGAVTGIVGVNRDSLGFGMGAKPVANVYGFCFAPPNKKKHLYRDKDQKMEMLSSKRIADGVIQGINAGGNQSGIPTQHGFMLFDETYRGKPLVFAGTVGLIPKKDVSGRVLYEKKAEPGDFIVMVGGRVGLDGIHGATFSSVEMDSGSPATAVQIGDPITQKKFSDAICKEARDLGLYNSITDNGAGGLSSSVGEMARESGGCEVILDSVPLKYPGLEPWQVWISESQERMTLAVPKKKWPAFKKLMESRGVESTVIGMFTSSGSCVVTYGNKKIMDVELDFLHDGLPQKHLVSKKIILPKEPLRLKEPKDLSGTVLALLSSMNIASNEFLARQFDHEVQGGSVVKPVQGAGRIMGDVSVFRPLLSSRRGVVVGSALTPHYAVLDPYHMAGAAIDNAIRNAVAVGATLDHLAILDNFCWASSDEPERLWQLKESARACYDMAVLYGTPFISGKDSMFNDFKGYDEKGNFVKISALPTLLISTLGVMEDATRAISIDVKYVGDSVYVLGETHNELGGSEYARMNGESLRGEVPKVDAKKNIKLYRAFTRLVEKEIVASAISVGRGGLAVALLKTALAGKKGLNISLSKVPSTINKKDVILFSESQGRFVVTVAPENEIQFEKILRGMVFRKIGQVTAEDAVVIKTGNSNVRIPLAQAFLSYRKTFKDW